MAVCKVDKDGDVELYVVVKYENRRACMYRFVNMDVVEFQEHIYDENYTKFVLI